MSETSMLPPLITDYSSVPAGSEARFLTGNSQSGWSRGGTTGFGVTTPGRFGFPSNNAFFTRHTANPKRVKHIKGLLGVPICSVNDDGYFSNPRYSFQYQPQTARTPLSVSRGPMTSSSRASMTSQGDLRSMLTRSSKADKVWGTRTIKLRRTGPPKAFVPEVWRDELRAITDVVIRPRGDTGAESGQHAGQTNGAMSRRSNFMSRAEVTVSPNDKPTRKTQYSTETGRLVPSSSKQLTSRNRWTTGVSGSRDQYRWAEINEETQADDLMMQMLCQVLQTEDIGAVQAWLISAHDRDKATVIEMIRSAMDDRDLQDLLEGTNAVKDRQSSNEWSKNDFDVNAVEGKVDRLLIEDHDINETTRTSVRDDVKVREQRADGLKSHLENADDDKNEFDKARRPVTAGAFRRNSKHSSEHRAERDHKNPKSCLKKANRRELSMIRESTNLSHAGKDGDKEMVNQSTLINQPMKRSNTTVY